MATPEHRKQPRRPRQPMRDKKERWHPYSLQALSPRRLMTVAGPIVQGEYEVMPLRESTKHHRTQRTQTVCLAGHPFVSLEASNDSVCSAS